jgi:hypothetical protein
VTVTQAGYSTSLTVSPTTWNPGSAAASTTVTVTSPGAWSAGSSQAWLMASPGSGAAGTRTVTVSVTANTSTAARTGTITFLSGGATAILTVTQAGTGVVDECGSTMATACAWTLLSSGTTSRVAGLQTSADTDLYKFTAPVSGTWRFWTSGIPSGADTYGQLYNSAGTRIAYNDDGGGSYNFLISYTLTAGQTYYLLVSNYSSSAYYTANPYTLNAARG